MQLNTKSKVYLTVIVVVLVSFVVLFIKQKLYPLPVEKSYQATISSIPITVEVADNMYDRTRGLSERESLAPDAGMFFVYPDYQERVFWMGKMRFPIDIIWLKDKVVVGFYENLPPPPPILNLNDEDIPKATSVVPVNGVLEFNAGFIKQNQIKIGDTFQLLDF
jgi:uncharacterized membrane protein (UPF0127 family)